MFDFREKQYFCLGRHFPKHKMTRYAKNVGGHGPLPHGYVNAYSRRK